MLGVWFARDRSFYGTKAFSRRVTALTSRVRLFAVDFHKLRIINIVTERTGHANQVCLVAIAGQLNAVIEALAQIGKKFPRRLAATVANVPRGDQLCVGVDCGPRPHVASLTGNLLFNRCVQRLGVNERPNLIDLDTLAGEVAEFCILIIEAGATGINYQLSDRVFARPGQPGYGADRATLTKEVQDLGAGLCIKLVHRVSI